MERTLTTVEKLLNGEFSGDPRCSRFPLPVAPEGTPPNLSYTHSAFQLTPEIARDWVLHRSIRRDVMPRELVHDQMVPNRKYLIGYAKWMARKVIIPDWWEHGTHQGGAMTPDGYILDFQHRCLASALSGVTLTLPLAVNVPWSAWKAIDQQRNRSAQQMIDLPYATTVAATARHLLPVLEGYSSTVPLRTGRAYTEQIVEIALGWPYFQEDQSWMKEIHEAGEEACIPVGALGASCIGALAGGAPADDVQQFLNGLRRISQDPGSITIGTDGADPRKLAFQHFRKLKDKRPAGGRLSDEEARSAVGTIRHAMEVWLRRHSEKPKKIKIMQKWAASNDLPPLWNEDAIFDFHVKHVN